MPKLVSKERDLQISAQAMQESMKWANFSRYWESKGEPKLARYALYTANNLRIIADTLTDLEGKNENHKGQ